MAAILGHAQAREYNAAGLPVTNAATFLLEAFQPRLPLHAPILARRYHRRRLRHLALHVFEMAAILGHAQAREYNAAGLPVTDQ
jgi:hypothetical protein